MLDLSERNEDVSLASEERRELENFVKAGHMVALLHSKASRSVKADRSY
jgi:hypothetical protein